MEARKLIVIITISTFEQEIKFCDLNDAELFTWEWPYHFNSWFFLRGLDGPFLVLITAKIKLVTLM